MTRMPIVVVGHVDHGKSTIVGRILADTGSLPEGKLDRVRELCARTSKPFEYAFLLDALKAERDQGITIDAARVFFSTSTRAYVVLDAPGHVEFLRNMVTGAAHAEAALLVVDAHEGVRENSRRHASMLAMLGVRHVAVLVNKMDLVDWSEAAFTAIAAEMRAFLGRLGVIPSAIVPVSGRLGVNLVARGAETPWHTGPTAVEALDAFPLAPSQAAAPFRLPVQDVYKFTRFGDDRRIVAGTVESGTVRPGDALVFQPSGKRSRVRSIEAFNEPPRSQAAAGQATGLTLDEQIYTGRGEVATRLDEPAPLVSSRLKATVFWLGSAPLTTHGDYTVKLGHGRAEMRVERIERVLDAATLDARPTPQIDRHEVGDCVLALSRALAFDRHADLPATGRFVILDDGRIRGGGIVRDALPDRQAWVRSKVRLRAVKWEPSRIAPARRAARFGQQPALLIVTGDRDTDRKGLAKQLEERLFAAGRNVYFLGMANMLYGVDADLARSEADRQEIFRRLGEVANLMLDAGLILVVSAAEVRQADLDILAVSVPGAPLVTAWLGAAVTTDVACDLVVAAGGDEAAACEAIAAVLRERGIIAGPW